MSRLLCSTALALVVLGFVACAPLTETVDSSVCLSGVKWLGGESGDAEMKPGNACISCHTDQDGPAFSAAGTVYGDLAESDDCFGYGGVTVVITDADNREYLTTTNSAGNFYFEESVKMPYTAKVIYDGVEREMVTPQSSGDCNSCHTKTGAEGTAGRIIY